MAEGRISESYQNMSVEDQVEFNRWLKANAVVASIFSAAVIAMIRWRAEPWNRR